MKVYKILINRNGVLGSIMTDMSGRPILAYKPDKKTRSPVGPVMAFETKESALRFMGSDPHPSMELWECEGERMDVGKRGMLPTFSFFNITRKETFETLEKFWNTDKLIFGVFAPPGTVFLSEVTLNKLK